MARSPETIDFSIIVPTRDRHAQLAACLDALAELRYPASRFEVVVVDDGSRTPVEPVLEPRRERLQIRLRTQPGAGPARARNHGADAARGRFLAFTDDDCAPAPDWLEKLAVRLADAPDAVAGGCTVNLLKDNLFATASQSLLSYLYEYFSDNRGVPWFLASCNFALAASTFHSVGGFDPSYPTAAAEDRDICDRLRLHGYSMVYAPDAVVYHEHALDLRKFWSQHFGYGRGACRFWRAHRDRSGGKIRIEPPAFYWGMLMYPLRHRSRASLAVAALLLVSQVANLAGFLCEWRLCGVRLNSAIR